MKTSSRAAFILFSITLISPLLHAQATPSRSTNALQAAEYCRNLANGNEQAQALESACQFAISIQQKLPNFVCDERIERWDSGERLVDVLDAQVSVEDGEVTYSGIRVNGKRTEKMVTQMPGLFSVQGVLSKGEFGTQLAQLFAPENRAAFSFNKEVKLNSRTALLFGFKIR